MVLEVHPDSLKKLVVSDPDISDLLLAAFIARRRLLLAQNHGDITLVGSRYSPEIYALREFLERNSRPFNWIDIETDPAADQIVNRFGLGIEETPAVVTAEGVICRNPSVERLAEELGLSDIGVGEIYDMAVVGAGPAGLAAAVYGGSEGWESQAPNWRRTPFCKPKSSGSASPLRSGPASWSGMVLSTASNSWAAAK